MSVRRKGPKATAARVGAYAALVIVAVVVVFPFVVAVATSLKSADDVFSYPPTLIPQEAETEPASSFGLEGEEVPLYDFEGETFGLVDANVSIAEYTPLDAPDELIRQEVGVATETGDVVVIDGEEEAVFLVEVDGTTVEAWRSRLTTGGRFVSTADPSVSQVELVNLAEPQTTFGPRFENFTEVIEEKDLGRALTNTVLVTIAGSLGLGHALAVSGAAQQIADGMTSLAGSSPWMTLVLVYLMTMVLTELVTNNAAAVLMFFVAESASAKLGVDFKPFAITIMMAASASFSTPLGYQTNLMVMAPGGYKFMDYTRVGAPLNLLSMAITVGVTPLVFGF